MLTPLACCVTSRIVAGTIQAPRRYHALDLPTSREARPEKPPLVQPRHRTLRLIHLELERQCDESRLALPHPLPVRSLRTEILQSSV